jgi:hypothetical protein
MAIGALDHDGHWDAMAVGQQTPFRAQLPAVGRVASGAFFPQGRFGHCAIHGLPRPLQALPLVIFQHARAPELGKHSGALPGLKAVVDGTGDPQMARKSLPLTPGA